MQPCLPEELAEIYSTPTPNGGERLVKSKSTILIDMMCPHYNSRGSIFIPKAQLRVLVE